MTPDNNKIKVFNAGKPKGSIGSIPLGGQIQPIATDGTKLL